MEPNSHLPLGDVVGTVAKATPEKRKRGKSMSRRSGQSGYIEVRGKYYVVRFWKDIPGQEERMHASEKICPISGPGRLTKPERERKAKESRRRRHREVCLLWRPLDAIRRTFRRLLSP